MTAETADVTNNDFETDGLDNTCQQATTSVKEVIPAVDVSLTGKHLIEASAGTGKTWTLTGIVLRLLIEARRAPEQIIATTFTRAAAAEMRQRIHDRLVDFYQLLQWVHILSANPDNKAYLYPKELVITPELAKNETNNADRKGQTKLETEQDANELNQDIDANRHSENKDDSQYTHKLTEDERQILSNQRTDWLNAQAKLARLEHLMQDPINNHLVGYLLNHVHTYALSEAIKRTALVLTTLDKLFVGTLDSLAQKWLSEYSSETGYQQGMAIIEDHSIEQVTDSIIHDELRQFQSRLYHEQPKLYQLMEQQGKLTNVANHKGSVKRSLNFISAPIDEVALASQFDFSQYEKCLHDFAQLNMDDIQPYLNPDYRKSQGFNGGSNLFKKFDFILEVHQKINQYNIGFRSYLSKEAKDLVKSIKEAQFPDVNGKIKHFNKNKEPYHQAFFELETINKLMSVVDMANDLDSYIITVLANLNRHIVLAVRDRLPVILEERSQTTFSLQMVRLNQALSGRQGDKLARYIRHHYPIALIDESQDINGEQAMMIQNIYLPKRIQSKNNDNQHNKKANHEFLLLVGDPKQAIYGFRGGDVANYNYMKREFKEKYIWTLDINRRSNANLINALNHWFSMPTRLADKKNRLAALGDDIYYHYIEAANPDAKLSWLNNDLGQQQGSEQPQNDLGEDSLNKDSLNTDSLNKVSLNKASLNQEALLYSDVLPNCAVSLIHLPYDQEATFNEHEITARHIAVLLKSGQTLNGRPIQPSDIGVLARAKKDLKQVEDELVKLGVPTLTTSDVSIFETVMAEDVAAVLSAMLQPYRHDMVNRVLTSHLYGLSIKEAKAMMLDHDTGVAESAEDSKSAANPKHQPSTKNSSGSVNKKSYQDFITYLKEGAERWQRYGILSALHYLFDTSPIQPKGVWQSLAAHSEGDRHIMDLRHVMDVLAQYGLGMGEYELLAWFRQNIAEAPASDWAKQYPLPTESGVQLMTIHKSKGLEFPIVYVLGMDSASRKAGEKEDYGLYLYNVEQQQGLESLSGNQRRFSPVKGTDTQENYYAGLETDEGFDERKRLGYVAFTRASEQLYIVLKDPKHKGNIERKPVFFWFDTDVPKFELPERLKGTIGFLPAHKITEFYDNSYSNGYANNYANEQRGSHIDKSKNLQPTPIEYDDFEKVMKTTYFYGWAKTSFTALARQLDEATQATAVVDERIDDAIDLSMLDARFAQSIDTGNDQTFLMAESINNLADTTPIKREDDIRFTFVKGANAGSFLHEIFEKIDFSNKAQWSLIIDRAVSSYQLPMIYASVAQQQRILNNNKTEGDTVPSVQAEGSYHEAFINWIDEVLHTPLLASNQPLISIAPSHRFAELEFNMGLSETFKVEDINRIFQQYAAEDTDKHINLMPQQSSHLYRYLRGEIDLVYEYAGKYHVVDYKSNYLGNSLSKYNDITLNHAMTKAGYWLQAAIYQVALHRFLSMRISDYDGNEAKYLAPVEYVFLRGVHNGVGVSQDNLPHDEPDFTPLHQSDCFESRYGLVTWDIPIAFVKALDALFGRPNA